VLSVVTGRGETGAAVVDCVDFVQFTGSTRTGRDVATACARRLVPCSLELGGKDPAIVLADADLERAARGIAFGGLLNAGQTCVSVERVYVEAPVYDEFLARLTTHVQTLRVGHDDQRIRYDVDALANQTQVQIVRRHVEDATAAGAQTVTGGGPIGVGTFFPPTVLAGVDHSMACMTEEIFGPTLPVMKVADEAEAIAMANGSYFGLSATVWTRDRGRGERVARQLQVGAVNVNDAVANLFCFALPMGGWKQSGLGTRWGGAAGVHKYCRAQAITTPRGPSLRREMAWFPYSPRRMSLILGALRAVAARGRRRSSVTAPRSPD
jgi:acyl-CoA reductase-like NAD-dependent aldehyde dehydrogenase